MCGVGLGVAHSSRAQGTAGCSRTERSRNRAGSKLPPPLPTCQLVPSNLRCGQPHYPPQHRPHHDHRHKQPRADGGAGRQRRTQEVPPQHHQQGAVVEPKVGAAGEEVLDAVVAFRLWMGVVWVWFGRVEGLGLVVERLCGMTGERPQSTPTPKRHHTHAHTATHSHTTHNTHPYSAAA